MLLLNVCCAPCGLPIIEDLLSEQKIEALYFYNPNIFPEEEYEKRLEETEKVASLYNLKLYQDDYDHANWLKFITGKLSQAPESYPENSERCSLCFRYRLEKTALFAKDEGIPEFATTLSVSRFKDTKFINSYGEELAKTHGLKYIPLSLDANVAHQKGIELSKKHAIYRQKYCGCEFSLPKAA